MKLSALSALLLVAIAAPASAAETAEPPPSPSRMPPMFVRANGGLAAGSLFSIPVSGPAFGAAFGIGERRSWGGIDGVIDVTYDALSTERDIGIHSLAFGSSCEFILWRFRIGAGIDIGSTWIARLSGSALSAHRTFLGLHASAGFDLFTVSGVTAYVAARGDYNAAVPTLGGNGGFRVAF